jgi:hypothetical protein
MLNQRTALRVRAPLEVGREPKMREGLLKRNHLGPELVAFDFDRAKRWPRAFARRAGGDLRGGGDLLLKLADELLELG